MGKNYENYEDALIQADLESLKTRREELCKKIAKKCVSSDNMRVNSLFTEKIKVHTMATRDEEYYQVKHANTGRLMKSAVPFMQRLLNLEENDQQKRKAINEHNIERKKRRPG